MTFNRKTHDHYDKNNKLIPKFKPILFNQPLFTQKNKEILINKVPYDFRNHFEDELNKISQAPYISDEEKYYRAKDYALLLHSEANSIRKAGKNPELINKIHAHSTSANQSKYQAPDFGPLLAKLLVLTGFGYVAPVAATAFQIGAKIYEGIAPGSEDYCGINTYYCAQGYIQDKDNHIAPFSRTLHPGGAKNNGDILLKNCLNVERVGNTIAKFAPSLNGTETCTANSVPYYQTTASVQAFNLPENSCDKFQQAFSNVFNDCMNESTSVALTIGKWVGVGIGSAVGVAAIAVAAYCIYNRQKSHELSDRPTLSEIKIGL